MRHCVLNRMCLQSFHLLSKISDQHFSANKLQVLWEEGSRHTHTEKGRTEQSLQLPRPLSAASVSIRCGLGRRRAVYCKSCWWAKCNCGCTQTRSSGKLLLLVDLPLFHVMVELLMLLLLLLLLWSRKQLADLAAHGNCCTNDDEEDDITAIQEPLTITLSLSLSLSLYRSSHSKLIPQSWSTSNTKKLEYQKP